MEKLTAWMLVALAVLAALEQLSLLITGPLNTWLVVVAFAVAGIGELKKAKK